MKHWQLSSPVIPRLLLDVGGNTGRWATKCVSYDDTVEVTIMDLPQQLEMMRQQTKELPGATRIHGHGANLLDPEVPFPTVRCYLDEPIPRLFLGRRSYQHIDPCSPFHEPGEPPVYYGDFLEPAEI